MRNTVRNVTRFSNVLFIGIISCILLSCQIQSKIQSKTQSQRISEDFLSSKSSTVLVVVHRGDWQNAPENSIPAITNCIEMGADMVEIDIRKTKDNQFVLMHDGSIDRTTNGKGKLSSYTLEELRRFRLKDNKGNITELTVPTLEEAMLAAKGKILVNLDKCYGYFDEVYQILENTGTLSQVVMKGGVPVEKLNKEFGQYLENIIFMPIVNIDKPNADTLIDNYQKQLKPAAFELIMKRNDSKVLDRMEEIRDRGARLWLNTLWDSISGGYSDDKATDNPDAIYGEVVRKGFTIIQTDRPKLLLEYLRKKGLHD